uniref:Uncharacterized protein n=1 Tax=viral metagenome TaxID=1070528 RepID=A0A6M3XR94_9ZZZZ
MAPRSPKAGSKAKESIELRKGFFHSLPVTLTADELVERRQQLLAKMDEIDDLKAGLAAFQKDVKDEVSGLEKELRVLRNVLKSGKEVRKVECYERVDWERGLIETFRVDFDELVLELGHRKIKPEERQTDLESAAGEEGEV